MEYLTYEKLVAMHILAMRDHWHESYFGVGSPGLLQSALARPQNASHYEQADGLRQAAYLFQGLLMNHGFVQGNKRTAWLSLRWLVVLPAILRGECLVMYGGSARNETRCHSLRRWATSFMLGLLLSPRRFHVGQPSLRQPATS